MEISIWNGDVESLGASGTLRTMQSKSGERSLAQVLTPLRLKLATAGAFAYAALFITEGTGLLMRKRWAHWLTIIATLGGLVIPAIAAIAAAILLGPPQVPHASKAASLAAAALTIAEAVFAATCPP